MLFFTILSNYESSCILQALSCTCDDKFTYAINLCTKQINLTSVNGLQHITISNNCINITIIAENEFGTRKCNYFLNAANSGYCATANHFGTIGVIFIYFNLDECPSQPEPSPQVLVTGMTLSLCMIIMLSTAIL